jgi:hypothetical protein
MTYGLSTATSASFGRQTSKKLSARPKAVIADKRNKVSDSTSALSSWDIVKVSESAFNELELCIGQKSTPSASIVEGATLLEAYLQRKSR